MGFIDRTQSFHPYGIYLNIGLISIIIPSLRDLINLVRNMDEKLKHNLEFKWRSEQVMKWTSDEVMKHCSLSSALVRTSRSDKSRGSLSYLI